MRAHVMSGKITITFSDTRARARDGRGLEANARLKVNGWEQCGHKKAASPATGGFGYIGLNVLYVANAQSLLFLTTHRKPYTGHAHEHQHPCCGLRHCTRLKERSVGQRNAIRASPTSDIDHVSSRSGVERKEKSPLAVTIAATANMHPKDRQPRQRTVEIYYTVWVVDAEVCKRRLEVSTA